MVVRSYKLRKRSGVSVGLMLLIACSGSMQAGLTDFVSGLRENVSDVFHSEEGIGLPSFDLPGVDTAKKFFALNGMMSAFSGSSAKWLPKVAKRFLSKVDTEENVNAMAEIFTGSLAANVATGRLHTNKLRSAVGAALIAVTARWVDTALRLTPWTKDLACPNAKCKGLCDDCKFHKANVGLWAYGIVSGAVHEIASGKAPDTLSNTTA